MTEVESSPIVILSEDDDDEDDDDIVVLKEEKVPIQADDDNDDEVIFIAQSQPSTSLKAKDSGNSGPIKSEQPIGKEVTRSLSLTTTFDLSMTLTGPLDLSKPTEHDDDSNPNTSASSGGKLDKESPMVDLEEADSQQSFTDDILDSVAGSSLDSSLIGQVSDSDNSNDSSVSMPTGSTSTWPVKWSPQPSTSGAKSHTSGCSTSSSEPNSSRSSTSSSDIDDFLDLIKTYDPVSPQSDNQSSVPQSVPPVTPFVPVPALTGGSAHSLIHSMSCDTTTSSSPTGLSVSNNASGIGSSVSSAFKPVVQSNASSNVRYPSSQDSLLQVSATLVDNLLPTNSVHSSNATNVTINPGPKAKTLSKPSCVSNGPAATCGPGINPGSVQPASGLPSGCASASAASVNSSKSSSCSSASGSGLSSYKLNQYSLPIRKRVRQDVKTEDPAGGKTDDACVNCKCMLQDLKVSRCTQGHPACGTCLEDQVKLILTDKQGSLKCIMVSCGSYYPMSELKHTLPAMVVEILEDKLHKDYINFVADMMLKDTGDTDQLTDKSTKSVAKGDDSTSPKKAKCDDVLDQFEPLKEVGDGEVKPMSPDEHPQNWELVDKKMNFAIMSLEPESDEYVDVALKFHNTLAFPSADIVKIARVQNPILWKYYQLKRTEMITENDGLMVDERQLFHGTNSSVIEAICRKGFDWRVCGKHGSVYGQGSYFAKAASYSHQYTEKQNSNSSSSQLSAHAANRVKMVAIRTYNAIHQSINQSNNPLFRQNQSRVLLGAFNPMNNLVNPHILPPPAHMPLSSSIFSSINGQMPQSNSTQPSQARSNLANNLTIITSNNYTSPLQSNSSNPVMTSAAANMQSLPSLPSSGNTVRGNAVSNLGSSNQMAFPCATMFNTSNNNPGGTQFNFPRQQLDAQPPSLQNNAQKSTKDVKSRVLSVPDITSLTTRKMFLAKVLVGKYTGGSTSHRRPPPYYSSEPYGKCYDSCVDNIWDPKIFVIFDRNQAYPEYIVEYNVVSE